MIRREDGFTATLEDNVAGERIKRNPGVACVWYSARYEIFPDATGVKFLIEIGEAVKRPTWWCEGRPATRAEVEASIGSGLPLLQRLADREATPVLREAARRELDRGVSRVRVYLPRVDPPDHHP
jgi:hypothetical protein